MANNSTVTTRMVTFKVLDELLNNLKIVMGFDTSWSKEFGQKGNKIGDVLLVRKPQRWLTRTGAVYNEQAILDVYTTITIDRHRHIGFDYGAFEAVLNLDDMYNRFFKKQTNQLANTIDDEASQFAYLNTNNINGTLGANPATLADAQDLFLTAYAILMENGCSPDDLSAIFWPRMAAAVMKYLNQGFNPQAGLGQQFLSGNLLSNMMGFKRIAVDQNIYTHTAGVFTGTPLVNGASVDGDTQIVTNGWTAADTLKAGDPFSIAAVNNINPKNRRSNGVLKRLVAAADCVADGSGNMTIPLGGGFALHDANQQQGNVDVLPANAAALTIWPGTTSPSGKSGAQSLAFGPQAFMFCPITLPDVGQEGALCSQATDPDTGASMTMVRQVNAESYRRIARLDTGFGFGVGYPDNESCRLVGA